MKAGDDLGNGLWALYSYDEAVDAAAYDSAKRAAESMREACLNARPIDPEGGHPAYDEEGWLEDWADAIRKLEI